MPSLKPTLPTLHGLRRKMEAANAYYSEEEFLENVFLPVLIEYMSPEEFVLKDKKFVNDSTLSGKVYYHEILVMASPLGFHDITRMSKPVFFMILKMCKVEGNLKDGRHICAGEKLMIYLYMESGRSGTTHRKAANRFQHSTSTISRMVANVAELIVALNDIEAFPDEELLSSERYDDMRSAGPSSGPTPHSRICSSLVAIIQP
jgi:hypothetical protein